MPLYTWHTKSHETAYKEAKRLVNLGKQFSYFEDPEKGHTFSYPSPNKEHPTPPIKEAG